MPAIVAYPSIVEDLLSQYGDLFGTEAVRRHFAEYLTGLYVAERKTVSGINREFVDTTDQSCLNRWLTEVEWHVDALNRRRLDLLQRDPSTRYTSHGVIALDNTLIDHDGKLIANVGWFWDHADKRYLVAHDYLIANCVCHCGKHYPLEFRRFGKREQCKVEGTAFKNHTALCIELEVLNHIQQHKQVYVGDLKLNRVLSVEGEGQRKGKSAQRRSGTRGRPPHKPMRIYMCWKHRFHHRPQLVRDTEAGRALVVGSTSAGALRACLCVHTP